MKDRFKLNEYGELQDRKTGYLMDKRGGIYFPKCNFLKRIMIDHFGGYVTARDLEGYEGVLKRLPEHIAGQYIEVGAGLGGFTDFLVSNLKPGSPRPIIIDPADYVHLLDILTEANKIEEFSHFRIPTLIDRCNLALDSSKVRLINYPLKKALKKFPDLRNCADFVADSWAACYYGSDLFDKYSRTRVIDLEKSLLLLGGKLVVAYGENDSLKVEEFLN